MIFILTLSPIKSIQTAKGNLTDLVFFLIAKHYYVFYNSYKFFISPTDKIWAGKQFIINSKTINQAGEEKVDIRTDGRTTGANKCTMMNSIINNKDALPWFIVQHLYLWHLLWISGFFKISQRFKKFKYKTNCLRRT